MKKWTATQVLGILGMVVWLGTGVLRETACMDIPALRFMLGIAPNIGALWGFAMMVELFCIQKKKVYSFKIGLMSIGVLCLCAVGSEIVHDLFLNSPFDVYDMIATLGAAVIYVVTVRLQSKQVEVRES